MAVTLVSPCEGTTGTTSGTTVSHANSGPPGNAFDSVTISGTGTTVTYDSAHAAHGALAIKFVTGTSGNAQVQWTTSLTGSTIAQLWFRLYLYLPSLPSATLPVFRAFGASARAATLQITTGGVFQFVDNPGTNGAGSPPASVTISISNTPS